MKVATCLLLLCVPTWTRARAFPAFADAPPLHLFFTLDGDAFLPGLQVAAASAYLSASCATRRRLRFHVVVGDAPLGERTVRWLRSFVGRRAFWQRLEVPRACRDDGDRSDRIADYRVFDPATAAEATAELLNFPHAGSREGARWRASASYLYRAYLADLWPELHGAVVYLDADLVVTGDIADLVDTATAEGIGGAGSDAPVLAGVLRPATFRSTGVRLGHPRLLDALWGACGDRFPCEPRPAAPIDPSDRHFNIGVLVIDLDAWRRWTATEFLVRMLRANFATHLFHNDQHAYNLLFHKRGPLPAAVVLPDEWNRSTSGCVARPCASLPRIAHFVGAGHKPWLRDAPVAVAGGANLAGVWHRYHRLAQLVGGRQWKVG